MGSLDGKVAFITGAARGQGRHHAIAFAEQGADLVLLDTATLDAQLPYPGATAEDLAQTVAAVEAHGRRVVAIDADIRDLAAVRSGLDAAVAELGRLDVVVANAGIFNPAPTLEMDESTWDEMIEINLTGQWKTLRAAVPHVVATGEGGSVVIVSSLAAMYANEGAAHYSAAKAGLVGLMQVMAKELAPQGIRVNTVHPTLVATDMVLNDAMYRLFRPDLEHPSRSDFEAAAGTLNKLPTPMLEASDITHAVLYLATDAGRYVTGTTFVVDAGGRL